jgi:hypothetical protein
MLTEIQLRAADLVARDRLSLAKIARTVGVSERTLDTWKASAEFRSEIERLLNRWAENIEKRGIADKRLRIFNQANRYRRALAFIEKRAQLYRKLVNEPSPPPVTDDKGNVLYQPVSVGDLLRNVPGGETGMVAWKFKTLHVGEKKYEKIVEYEYDTGLEACIEALEEHTATELGQWKPKQEIILSRLGSGGPLRDEELANLNDDELDTYIALTEKAQSGRTAGGASVPQAQPNAESVSGPGAAPAGTLPKAP